MTDADPCHRLAAELPSDGCREALARLDQARRRHERARIMVIEVDEEGQVHVEVLRRFGRLRAQLAEEAAYERRLLEKVEKGLTNKP